MNQAKLPVVGVICDREIIGPHAFHIAGDKYLQALISASNCLPVLIPALADEDTINQLMGMLDGILLTGGYSMVDPLRYQEEAAISGTKLDTARDNTSIPLVVKAVEQGMPVFGICRGFQEMNVAFGGSLHQELHQHAQFFEHREDKNVSLDEQYSDTHKVKLTTNGKLAEILGESAIKVNSLHTQGVDRLANNLLIEAVAEDGLVEAFSVVSASTFAMAVQWHPEWKVENNPHRTKLFHAFGQACLAKQITRENHE